MCVMLGRARNRSDKWVRLHDLTTYEVVVRKAATWHQQLHACGRSTEVNTNGKLAETRAGDIDHANLEWVLEEFKEDEEKHEENKDEEQPIVIQEEALRAV